MLQAYVNYFNKSSKDGVLNLKRIVERKKVQLEDSDYLPPDLGGPLTIKERRGIQSDAAFCEAGLCTSGEEIGTGEESGMGEEV